jgi:hypothetical protein
MAFFTGRPFWKWLYVRSASAAVQQRTKALVDKNPQLKPAWDVAMQDGVLTVPEARIIVELPGRHSIRRSSTSDDLRPLGIYSSQPD